MPEQTVKVRVTQEHTGEYIRAAVRVAETRMRWMHAKSPLEQRNLAKDASAAHDAFLSLWKERPVVEATTVKVRVAVAVDADGDWCAYGAKLEDDAVVRDEASLHVRPGCQIYWLTAGLRLPAEPEVAARVEGEG